MHNLALSTDLYQLAMVAGYHESGLMARSTFELSVRDLPRQRSFLIAAGVDHALEYLETLRFTREDIEHVRALPALASVGRAFFDDYLPGFRFTGEVWAVAEGTPLFGAEPFLRVTAPLPEAQLVETALLAQIAFPTSVASRTARVVAAAAGRDVVEYGLRRAHGIEAGVLASRAAYLGGAVATSNVEAGRRFGIPVSGTMAHSWVMAFPDEATAFGRYAEVFGDRAVILLDTYDALAAARAIVTTGLRPSAVRIDSGDLVAMSRAVRAILDDGGLRETRIIVSGDLDEWRIAAIVDAGAPVDGFGVGAALSAVTDVPSIGAIYKLVEIEREGRLAPVMKLSPGKRTYPGRKQLWRIVDRGTAVEDVVELDSASVGDVRARPLLARVMRDGRREAPARSVTELRNATAAAIAELPASLRRLHDPERYTVRFGDALKASL